ncbi:MAG: chitobiase/beta-hexosaminidase C-terminal domain-containing protein [Chitinophagaceae bacterium]|nr:chitobiase/beta-hexosaminidase C-terminal domain-containing protein [Chitinophagaceae bacterium]
MGGSNLVKTIVERSLIPLNSLLLFFLLFEPRIVLPGWLQVFGRMHPLALHFPIVLILLYVVMTLFFPGRVRNQHWYQAASDALLLTAAFTASVTALMGFALSRNDGYDEDAIAIHKWTGVLIPFLLYIFYLVKDKFRNIYVTRGVSIFLAVMITLAGHHGAIITHGENFILAPLTPAEQRVVPAFEDAYVYNDLVQPILDNKCAGCHNSSKAKGELVMDTKELFMKGGENGVPWDTARQDLGLMMRMVHLPVDHKEHMPPKGKTQLTDDEMFILHEWVKTGANFERKLTDLTPSDTLYAIGKKLLPSSSEELYDFPAADESQVAKLNNNNRVITPVAQGSPALNVTFYNSRLFNISAVKELNPISNNIVELNLMKMAVKDEDLAAIREFKNLRRLNLNFTEVTGKTLDQLQSLENLRMISLSGTVVDYNNLKKVQTFPKLKAVYLWSTPAANSKLDDLEEKNKNIAYYAGYEGDTLTLQLTPPLIGNEEHVLTEPEELKLKHYINGAVIRYTLDGTTPDSTKSPVYKEGIMIDSNVTVKAVAFKKGWYRSNVLEYHFYKKKFTPDSVLLVTKPGQQFPGAGNRTINDNVRSENNFSSGKWIGYYDNDMVAILRFDKPITTSNVTVSVFKEMGRHIFPPSNVEVYGGSSPGNMKLLSSVSPEVPKENEPNSNTSVLCSYPPTTIQCMKLVVKRVRSMPSWHPQKGQKAWVFVDEVFVN